MPDTISVDIATRFLGEKEDIFVIRPGEGFSLYRDFVSRRSIFLDFPDIGLNLAGSPPRKERLREDIVRSIELRSWHRQRRKGDEPSRNPEDYYGKAKSRRIGMYVGAIERLYYKIKEGSIVVVPGPGYFSDVLIGEIVGDPYEIKDIALYPDEKLPARHVRWVGKREKADFPAELRERLQKPTPLMVLERSLRELILKAAYDQYGIGATFSSRFKTTQHDFSTLDDFNIQSFINYTSGVLATLDAGVEVDEIKLQQALAILRDRRDLIPELTSNINSPGAIRLLSTRIAPIVIAVLLAIALATPAGTVPTEISVVNSAHAGIDQCALEVQEHAMNAIKMMDIDTWHQVCVQAREAAHSTGFSTTIKVIPDNPQP